MTVDLLSITDAGTTLPLLRSRLLDQHEWLRYGITRRIAGIDAADGNVSYSGQRDRALAWTMRRRWAAAWGVDAGRLVTAGQVHGTDVHRVRAVDAGAGATPDSSIVAVADALMTDEVGPVLLSMHADCLPLLFADPEHRAVAVAHAGWRGTVGDMAGETVRRMAAEFGSDPGSLVVYLGPAICGAHYEVGPEVADAWRATAGETTRAIEPGLGDRWHFDLVTANRERLMEAGVRETQIESSGICTSGSSMEWFSHRAQGPRTGRFGAMIAIAQPEDATT